jgi:hypothetical protein
MFRTLPGLKWFIGALVVCGAGLALGFATTAAVGIPVALVGLLVAIAFQYPKDWRTGWPPPWIARIWSSRQDR